MPDCMDNNFRLNRLIEDDVRIRRGDQAANGRVFSRRSHMRVERQKSDSGFDPGLDSPSALGRMRRDVIEDRFEIGKRRQRVADSQSPYLRQIAAICSSVANSPRAAAALDAAMAARSSEVSRIGSRSSAPASWSTTLAMSS